MQTPPKRDPAQLEGMPSSVSYFAAAALLVSAACACDFDEREGQVVVGLPALHFPLEGADAKMKCAAAASAFGMSAASVFAFPIARCPECPCYLASACVVSQQQRTSVRQVQVNCRMRHHRNMQMSLMKFLSQGFHVYCVYGQLAWCLLICGWTNACSGHNASAARINSAIESSCLLQLVYRSCGKLMKPRPCPAGWTHDRISQQLQQADSHFQMHLNDCFCNLRMQHLGVASGWA